MNLPDLVSFKEILSHLGDVTILVISLLFVGFSKRIKDWLEKKTNEKFEHSINKNTLIRDMLAELRALYGSDRVALWQLHNGQYYFSGEGADKLSLTHFVLQPGVSIPEGLGTKLQNVPVTHWTDAFSRMAKEGYHFVESKDLLDPFLAQSCTINGTRALVKGPVKDRRGHWRGVLIVEFTQDADAADTAQAEDYGLRIGDLLSHG